MRSGDFVYAPINAYLPNLDFKMGIVKINITINYRPLFID